MKRRAGLWWAAFALAVVAVAVSAGIGLASAGTQAASGRRAGRDGAATIHPAPSDRAPEPSRVKAVLADLMRTATAGRLTASTTAPGMPVCAPPPVPTATNPPGRPYGVPFLAAITDGQVLAGYDQWSANHLAWTVGKRKFALDPWGSKIFDITGWVTGLLQLPSLTAEIPPQDVVFCDNGGASCLSAHWPAGQCIQIQAQYGPSPASFVPPPALGSYHPEGVTCSNYSTPTFACFPYVVSLVPSGTTTLSVSGVEPDGALDLSVKTAAVTTVSEVPPPPSTTTFTCTTAPATVTLSTQTTPLPATAPGPPVAPNTDERSLRSPPAPVTGPLTSATSKVASNDFGIPAFFPSASGSPCSIFLAYSLNTYAGGWNSVFNQQDTGNYYLNGGTNPIAAQPGWAQFTANTTVVSLGLPVGPPPGGF